MSYSDGLKVCIKGSFSARNPYVTWVFIEKKFEISQQFFIRNPIYMTLCPPEFSSWKALYIGSFYQRKLRERKREFAENSYIAKNSRSLNNVKSDITLSVITAYQTSARLYGISVCKLIYVLGVYLWKLMPHTDRCRHKLRKHSR